MGEPTAEDKGENDVQGKLEGLRIRDYMDIVSELVGLVRDSNITRFQLTLLLCEETETGFKQSGQRSEPDGFLNQFKHRR